MVNSSIEEHIIFADMESQIRMLKKEKTAGKKRNKNRGMIIQEKQNLNYQKSCKEYGKGKAFRKIGEKGVIVSIYEKKEDK